MSLRFSSWFPVPPHSGVPSAHFVSTMHPLVIDETCDRMDTGTLTQSWRNILVAIPRARALRGCIAQGKASLRPNDTGCSRAWPPRHGGKCHRQRSSPFNSEAWDRVRVSADLELTREVAHPGRAPDLQRTVLHGHDHKGPMSAPPGALGREESRWLGTAHTFLCRRLKTLRLKR